MLLLAKKKIFFTCTHINRLPKIKLQSEQNMCLAKLIKSFSDKYKKKGQQTEKTETKSDFKSIIFVRGIRNNVVDASRYLIIIFLGVYDVHTLFETTEYNTNTFIFQRKVRVMIIKDKSKS